MKLRIVGGKTMQEKLRDIMKRVPARMGAALYQEAQIEMTESKRRVPFEFGVLKASGFVAEPVYRGTNVSVTLSYGGAAEDYAIVQHERLDFLHPKGGQAKYLESVLNESAPYMATRIGRRLEFK